MISIGMPQEQVSAFMNSDKVYEMFPLLDERLGTFDEIKNQIKAEINNLPRKEKKKILKEKKLSATMQLGLYKKLYKDAGIIAEDLSDSYGEVLTAASSSAPGYESGGGDDDDDGRPPITLPRFCTGCTPDGVSDPGYCALGGCLSGSVDIRTKVKFPDMTIDIELEGGEVSWTWWF